MPTPQDIATKLTERIFKGRGRGNRQGIEVHLSKAELADLLEEGMKLALEVRADATPARKSLFPEHERMHLSQRGFTQEQIQRIRAIACALVEIRVLKGEVDPEVESELKDAVKQAGQEALSAYNAALEYVSG